MRAEKCTPGVALSGAGPKRERRGRRDGVNAARQNESAYGGTGRCIHLTPRLRRR